MTKVFIFGRKVHGTHYCEDTDEYEFTYSDYPNVSLTDIDSLPDYDVIILDYDAFHLNGDTPARDINLFSKHLLRALSKGAYVVFLIDAHKIPEKAEYKHETYEMQPASIKQLIRDQIGFRLLRESDAKLRPVLSRDPYQEVPVTSHYFNEFLDKWGSSHVAFINYKDDELLPIQRFSNGDVLSFSKKFRKGRLIYLACERNFNDKKNTEKLQYELTKAVISFRAHTFSDMPVWAEEPLFNEEEEIGNNISKLELELSKFKSQLDPYKLVKELAFKSDDEFNVHLCKFLSEHLELDVTSDEKYLEDFKVLDKNKEVIMVGEAKALNGGISKGAVYKLYSHREELGFDESVHGLLVVNNNLTATSWKEKDQAVDPKAYKAASKENILIVRVLDLMRLWGQVREGIITLEKAQELLQNERGWLKVSPDNTVEVK